MKNILLVCAGGLSTSLLVNKMNSRANEIGVPVNIVSVGFIEEGHMVEGADIILLGPQVRYHKDVISNLLKNNVPIEVIEPKWFARMNGEAILNHALTVMGVA